MGMYGVPECIIQFQLAFWRIWQNIPVYQVAFVFVETNLVRKN